MIYFWAVVAIVGVWYLRLIAYAIINFNDNFVKALDPARSSRTLFKNLREELGNIHGSLKDISEDTNKLSGSHRSS